jgi:ABC-type nitrate/sulfonate/bicarbonate transport system permease component
MSGVLRGGRGLLAAVLLPVVLVTGWWVLTADSTSFYMPPLRDVFTRFPEVWTLERIRQDVVPSVLRLGTGYLIALALGVAFGVLIGSARRLRGFLEPVLEFLRAVPPTVLVPVFMLFAGLGDTMKVLVIVSGAVWPILLNTIEGVRSTDSVMTETARSFAVSRSERLRYLVLPAASPRIMAGVRQSLSIALILMVISELAYSSSGLGYQIVYFQRNYLIAEMWSGILLLGLIGILLATVFGLVERRVLRWYHGIKEVERA